LRSSAAENSEVGEGRFVRNSIFLVSIELFTKLLGLILFMLMARVLGAADIGLYEGALAMAGFFALAVRLGFERLVQREVGRDTSRLYSHFREINVIKFIFAAVLLVVIWMMLTLHGTPDAQIMMMIAFFTFLISFSNFNSALFRGIGRPEFEVVVRSLFSLLNLSLGVFALYSGWGLIGVVSMQLISVGFSLVVSFAIIEKIADKVDYSWRWHTLLGHLKKAAPFAALLVVLFFGNQIKVIILALLCSRTEVGLFAAANRLFDNLTLIPMAIMGAFLPMMSRLYCTSIGRFTRTLRFTMKYLFIIAAPFAVGLMIVARPLVIVLYREHFEPSALVLQLLMPALFFSFWNCAASALLVARNREGTLIWLFAGGAVVNVIGNLVLIPVFSANGAAVAVVITQAFQCFIFGFLSLRRYLNLRILFRLIAAPAVCVAVMGVAVYFTLQINLWLAVAVGAVVYPTTLLLSGTVNKKDIESLKGMLGARIATVPPSNEDRLE